MICSKGEKERLNEPVMLNRVHACFRTTSMSTGKERKRAWGRDVFRCVSLPTHTHSNIAKGEKSYTNAHERRQDVHALHCIACLYSATSPKSRNLRVSAVVAAAVASAVFICTFPLLLLVFPSSSSSSCSPFAFRSLLHAQTFTLDFTTSRSLCEREKRRATKQLHPSPHLFGRRPGSPPSSIPFSQHSVSQLLVSQHVGGRDAAFNLPSPPESFFP